MQVNNDTERQQLIRAINSLKNCAEGIRRIKEITLHIPHTLIDKIFHLFRHHKVFSAFCLGSAKDFFVVIDFCCSGPFLNLRAPHASDESREKKNEREKLFSGETDSTRGRGAWKVFWIEKEKRGARLMTSYNF